MLWGDFNGYKIGLVQSVSDMDAIRADLHGSILCGIDTETTGLSYLRCHVVGVCLSTGRSYGKADYRGYYLPIRHLGYSKNLPIEAVISLTQHIVDNYKTAWWNRSFDFSMLEKDGFRCPFVGKTHDIQFMAHEMFNEEMPKLKDFSKRLLGFQTILFGDTGASEGDFGNTDPEVTFLYAGADAVQTALLGIKIWNEYPQVHQIYSMDNLSGEAVRLLTKTPLHLDYGFLKSEVSRCTMSLVELEQEIYGMVGYMFNVRSDREVADALSRFVTLTAKTASGAWKVDKSILGALDHPLAKLLLQHSELSTYLNSFVKKMSTWEKRSQPVRLNYNLVVALTGRLSSSASTGNDYYAPMNAQNIPKVEEKLYLHEHPTLGYCLCSEEEGCVRGSDGSPVKYKTKGGLRNAFIANASAESDDWVFLGADYSAEEIAVAANWSQEEGLLYPLKHGLDVHLHVAAKMFGVEDPTFRSKSKAVSFGKLYGGGASLIATRLKIALEAAKALIAHYDITLPRLKRWQEALVKSARRCGFAKTLFGRHIYVGKWFNSGDRAKVAYAERVSKNAPIQGDCEINTPIQCSCGYVPIGTLWEWQQSGELARRSVKCWNGVRWCDFSVIDAGVRPVYRFKFKRGNEIIASDRHLFKVWTAEGTEFKNTQVIPIGEHLCGSVAKLQEYARLEWKSPTRVFGALARKFDATQLTEEQSENLLYWVGYALGDGNFSSQGGAIEYTLGSHETSRYDAAKVFFDSLGLSVSQLRFRSREAKGRRGDAYCFTVSSVALRDALESVGIDYSWIHHTKRIPWQLFCSSVGERKALLRGLFDSDGSKKQEQYEWHMCQKGILLDIQRMLRTLGFDSVLYSVSDGSFRLVVCNTIGFARFFGLSDKGYGKHMTWGKWYDKRKTPAPLLQKFRDWAAWYPTLIYGYDLDKKQYCSLQVLYSRILRGGSVSLSTFMDLCYRCGCEHILSGDDFLEACEVVSVERLSEPAHCYCLSLTDECHCYESDGIISHNCFPAGVYAESQDDSVYRPWRDSVGRRMWFRDRRTSTSRQGVPTFRGTDPLWFVAFNTGDFCVCNDIHKFVRYGDESRLVDLNHICDEVTPLVPCGAKGLWSWLRGIGRGCSLARLAITAHMGRSISVGDGVIAWSLLKAWLGRKRYITDDPHRAFLLRSVCDLFGWNLVYDFRRSRKLSKYAFRLRWGRRKKAVGVIVRALATSAPVISPAMCSGLSVYPLGGFISKNTGGDLIRRGLIKLMQCIARDPECRENLEFQFTIHDEIQVRVRRSYLQKGVKLLQAIMNFWPKEFQTPIMVEPCVGFRLGGELDIDAVSSDGFIIPKGFTPPQSYLDAHPDWYYLDTWFKTMKARRSITEW